MPTNVTTSATLTAPRARLTRDHMPAAAALKASGLPIHPQTVLRWCRSGQVPALKVGFSRWWVRPADLRAMISATVAP
jgi:hypothetical protein